MVSTVKSCFLFREMLFDVFAQGKKGSVFIFTFTGTVFPQQQHLMNVTSFAIVCFSDVPNLEEVVLEANY